VTARRQGDPDQVPAGGTPPVRMRLGRLRDATPKDWLIRFAFGAGVSALAAVISEVAGPRIGGLFLAFPAILLASLTLVAKEDGPHPAREDARGATLGAAGLVAFALTGAVLLGRVPIAVALIAATAAWALVAFGAYVVMRRYGAGGDD